MRTSRARVQREDEGTLPDKQRDLDEMRGIADHLVRIAIQALMRMRNVDWKTATRCIKGAAASMEDKKPPLPFRQLPSRE